MRMFVNFGISQVMRARVNFTLTVHSKYITRQNSSCCVVNKSSIIWVGHSCNGYWNGIMTNQKILMPLAADILEEYT